jgi:hypothetical protein
MKQSVTADNTSIDASKNDPLHEWRRNHTTPPGAELNAGGEGQVVAEPRHVASRPVAACGALEKQTLAVAA